MEAFQELSTTRQMSMGLGPIPWNTIMDFAAWCGLDEENTEALNSIIREMDLAYLEWHQENSKADV